MPLFSGAADIRSPKLTVNVFNFRGITSDFHALGRNARRGQRVPSSKRSYPTLTAATVAWAPCPAPQLMPVVGALFVLSLQYCPIHIAEVNKKSLIRWEKS